MDTNTRQMVGGWVVEAAESAEAAGAISSDTRKQFEDHVHVRWSRRMDSSAGRCMYKKNGGIELAFSVRCATVGDESTLRNTVFHEVAHGLAFLEHGGRQGHGPKWKLIMRAMGLPAKRCHSLKVGRTARRTVRAHCRCMEHWLTKRMGASADDGKVTCRKCGTQIEVAR